MNPRNIRHALVGLAVAGVALAGRPCGATCQSRADQGGDTGAGAPVSYHNYVGTSILALASLLAEDVFFFELDLGRKVTPSADVVLGADVYQYTAPMSGPWSGGTEYPGHVLSYGVVLAHQRYFGEHAFLDAIVNPLVLNYHDTRDAKVATGFMLLGALRLGYHVDVDLLGRPFFLEAGAEVSVWPYNKGVPASFRAVDDKYGSHAFSPALQFGYRF